MDKKDIGFIGAGVMGRSMAGHLLKAGYRVHVFTRTKWSADALVAAGALWENSTKAVAQSCGLIFTMVGYPADVEELYFGPAGLIENAKPGSFLVDTTTSSPVLARRIAEAAAARGLKAYDAPVSGGDLGARNATLTIMVGGDAKDFGELKPVLEVMGKTIVLQGGPGSGQYTKMANQISVAASLVGAVEALSYAKAAGLDPTTVLASIGAGSAGSWQLNNLGPKMIAGDFEPGFYVKHILKDLGIALDSAREMKLNLPFLELAEGLFRKLNAAGYSDKGSQALFILYAQGLVSGAGK